MSNASRFCVALAVLATMVVTTGLVAADTGPRLPVVVDVQPRGVLPASSASLDLTWMGGRPVDEAQAKRSVPVDLEQLPGPSTLDLPDETVWQIQLAGDGIYSPTTLVNLLGDEDPGRVALPVYRTVPLVATLRTSNDVLPTEATLRFQPVSSSGAPEAGEVDCTLDERRATCPVPRVADAHLDLKLRVPGYASHFVWEREIPEDGLDLGSVELAVGGSLVGRVEAEDGPLPTDPPVAVTLVPAGTVPGQEDTERRGLLDETVQVDSRGFFHFRGVPSGSYRVQAEAEGYAPLVTGSVPCTGALEVELSEPLVLRRPVELTVMVEPAVDPLEKPWSLSLLDMSTGLGELIDRGRSDETGAWRTVPLPSGAYHLLVVDSRGTRMALEEVELTPEARFHLVRLDSVAVSGKVRLGGEPLPRARVIFGGRSGQVSIEMVADDSGEFVGTVSRPGAWNVDVVAHLPSVTRRLSGVEVTPSDDGTAWVPIELPDTAISGEVVDERDDPVPRAHVLLFSTAERPLQSMTDGQGEFAFHGLEPGRYRVEARRFAPEGTLSAEGEWLEVDDAETTSTRLVLRSQRRLGGIVSFAGRPAGGVEIVATSDDLPMVSPAIRSDVEGRFEIDVPEQLSIVTLTALLPGADLFSRSYSVAPPGEELSIQLVPASGATLWLDGFDPGAGTTVIRDGRQRFGFGLLRRWAMLNGVRQSDGGVRVPAMPAGLYEICDQSGVCSDGYLPPSGELRLESPVGFPDQKDTSGDSS